MPQLERPVGKPINEGNPVSLRIVNELVELYKKEELQLVPQTKLGDIVGLTPTAEVINGRGAMAAITFALLWGAAQGKVLQLVHDPRFFQ